MSHLTLRGKPTAAQFFLDGILNEVLVSRGEIPDAEKRERLSLPQILFHCLAKNPDGIFMINSSTGEKITNRSILNHAIPLARMLESKSARGKLVMVAMDIDQTMAALYLAFLFAGVLPFFLFPTITVFEISHFLRLLEPSVVFCGEKYYEDIKTALESLPELKPDIVLTNVLPEPLRELDVSSFQIPNICLDEAVLLVATSGSTGLPKACVVPHRATVAKLSAAWYLFTKFPTPTALALVMSAPSGIIFHRIVTSCVVFSVPVLIPHDCSDQEWVKSALLTYRPTWAQIGLCSAKSLLTSFTTDHLSSLRWLMLTGGQPCKNTTTRFMDLLPNSTYLEEVYGLTETYSVVASSINGEPHQLINLYEYKLIDENGNTLGLGATGELCVKGPALAKDYYKNNKEFLVDGWYKTGDIFYIDAEERLFYQRRQSVCFKFMHCHVSPEQVEGVISAIPGVSACAVGETERGPAAAVVARGVSREHVHQAVNDTLSLYKRLHGGVGFVAALPVLHSGKLDRAKCRQILQQLYAIGECY